MFIVLVYSDISCQLGWKKKWGRWRSVVGPGGTFRLYKAIYIYTSIACYGPLKGQSKSGVQIFMPERSFENSRRGQKVGWASPSFFPNWFTDLRNDYTFLIPILSHWFKRLAGCMIAMYLGPQVELSFFSDLHIQVVQFKKSFRVLSEMISILFGLCKMVNGPMGFPIASWSDPGKFYLSTHPGLLNMGSCSH